MWAVCLKSGLFVLIAGGPTQPGGEALCGQSLRADAHAGAHASRDAQTSVRTAAFYFSNFCIRCCSTFHILNFRWGFLSWHSASLCFNCNFQWRANVSLHGSVEANTHVAALVMWAYFRDLIIINHFTRLHHCMSELTVMTVMLFITVWWDQADLYEFIFLCFLWVSASIKVAKQSLKIEMMFRVLKNSSPAVI